MVRLPDADWTPFTNRSVSTTPLQMRGFLLHTMGVGTMWGSWNYHNAPGMPYTHLYYDAKGNRIQAQELELRAAGQLELNPYFISCETEDHPRSFPGYGSTCDTIAPWNDAQLDALSHDIVWCWKRFQFPLQLMTNACQSGIGYHRLGIPGGPEYNPNCPRTSNSTGKCCPAHARIHQVKFELFPDIVRLANGEIVALTARQDEMLRRIAVSVVPLEQKAQFDAHGADGRIMVQTLINEAIENEFKKVYDLLAQPRLELISAAGVNGALSVPSGERAVDVLADLITDRMLERLPTGPGGTLTTEQVKTSCKEAVVEVLNEGVNN